MKTTTKTYFQRESGKFTGATIVFTENGTPGFAFCRQPSDKYYKDGKWGFKKSGDQFNKKVGKQVAEGRARKLEENLNTEMTEIKHDINLLDETFTSLPVGFHATLSKVYNKVQIKKIEQFCRKQKELKNNK